MRRESLAAGLLGIIALSALFIGNALRTSESGRGGALHDHTFDAPSAIGKLNEPSPYLDDRAATIETNSRYENVSETAAAMQTNQTLEFVHITKTGGTSIELAAAAAGIAWSMCKFHLCPPLDETGIPRENETDWPCALETSAWHCPPAYLQRPKYGTAKLFAVVRNPYDRIVSEYYWRNGLRGKPGPNSPVNKPQTLNFWINRELDRVERTGVCTRGHCIPMHKYTHRNGTQVVDHILRLENITAELPILLEQYGLERIEVGHEYARSKENILNVTHLTKRTICRINEWANHDFHYFGYDMIALGGNVARNKTCA